MTEQPDSFAGRQAAFRREVVQAQALTDQLGAAYARAAAEMDRAAKTLRVLLPQYETAQAAFEARARALNVEADRRGVRADLVVPDLVAKVHDVLAVRGERLLCAACTCGGSPVGGR